MVAKSSGGGMGSDYWTCRSIKDIIETRCRKVRDICDYPKLLECNQCFDTGAGKPTCRRVLAASIRERVSPQVGERGDPYAKTEQRLEQLSSFPHRAAAFKCEDQGDVSTGNRGVDLCSRVAEGD